MYATSSAEGNSRADTRMDPSGGGFGGAHPTTADTGAGAYEAIQEQQEATEAEGMFQGGQGVALGSRRVR